MSTRSRPGVEFTVNSRKYDLSIRRSWKCCLIDRSDPLLVFKGEFEAEVEHPDLGTIAKGTTSIEYYWLDRWYNIFRFEEPNGSLRNWYCNVSMPPTVSVNVIDYVDLDIDIVAWPDGRTDILDQAEFEQHAEAFNYPDHVRAAAVEAVDQISRMIAHGDFPFDDDTFATAV